jgi:ATP-dependent Clp protease ATP-binding subunit ClpB
VLLDEIEKAHPDLFNLLLQVLDDGRLTDNKGRTVNFRNVIIIMTSNIGSDIIRDRMEKWNNKLPAKEEEQLRKDIFALLKRSLRPEFLNRIDEIVMFKPLTIEQIKEIVKIQLVTLGKLLATYNMELDVTDEAVNWLGEHGFDPQSGARPVKRLIQKEIVNELSKEVISGRITKDSVVKISVEKERLKFTSENHH